MSEPSGQSERPTTNRLLRPPGEVLAQIQEPLRISLLTELIQLETEQVYLQFETLSERTGAIEQLKSYYLEQCPEYPREILNEFGKAEAQLQALPATEDSLNVHETYFDVAVEETDSENPSQQFRILRSHAKGGLGEVFVALDQELNREVALKEIRSKFSDDIESRERFTREAEITAGLEHPGIVPVYASGHFADGRPFYVMRFIRGESLQEAIDSLHQEKSASSKRRALLRLLRRLIDACNAIAYAHSRGIIHRDIKPSNIMLGKHGETLVVDWGIARAVGRQEDSAENMDEQTIRPGSGASRSTVVGSAIGTPAYMSPEQAQGDLDSMGPASDVYSLGATLYCILCNTTPFPTGNLDNILKLVTQGNFRAPSEINPDTPRALEAICLRAMTKKLEDRYPSALALAEDLECFLTDTPISCFRDPWLTRLARTMRQHQATSAFVVASFLGGLIGLGVFWNQERQQNIALADLNRNLDSSNQALVLKGEMERQQRETALANEAEAKRQSELALGILNYVVTEVQEQLSTRPGVGDVRRDILQKAMDQLDEISSEIVDSKVVDRSLLTILSSLGQLSIRFNFGSLEDTGTVSPDSSGYEQGLNLLLKAKSIAERLHQQSPADEELEAELLEILLGIAKAHRFAGSSDSSDEFLKTTKRLQVLVEKHPTHLDHKLLLADALAYTSYSLAYSERFDTAELLSRQGLSLCEELLANELSEKDLAACTHYKALLLRVRGSLQLQHDPELAEQYFVESLAVMEELAAEQENDWQVQHELQIAISRVAKTLTKQNKFEQAHSHYDRLLSLAQESFELDPQNVSTRNNLALTEFNYGDLLLQLGKLQESQEHLARSREMFQELVLEGYAFERGYANAHLSSARLAMRMDNLADAESYFEIAAQIRRKHAQTGNIRPLRELSMLLDSMATLYLRTQAYDRASALTLESIAACEMALKKEPSNVLVRQKIAGSLSILATLHINRDEADSAMATLERELGWRRALSLETDSSRLDVERTLTAQKRLSLLLVESGQFEQARNLLGNSTRLLEQLENPTKSDSAKLLDTYEQLAAIASRQRDAVSRLQYLRKALELSLKLDPKDRIQRRKSISMRLEIRTLLEEMSAHREANQMAELAWQETQEMLTALRQGRANSDDTSDTPIDDLLSRQQVLSQASRVLKVLLNQASESRSSEETLALLRERLAVEIEISKTQQETQSLTADEENSTSLAAMRLGEFESRFLLAERLWIAGQRSEAVELFLVNSLAAFQLKHKPLHLSQMGPRLTQFASLLAEWPAEDSHSSELALLASRILMQAASTMERNNRYKRLNPEEAIAEQVLESWREHAKYLLQKSLADGNEELEDLRQEYPEFEDLVLD